MICRFVIVACELINILVCGGGGSAEMTFKKLDDTGKKISPRAKKLLEVVHPWI